MSEDVAPYRTRRSAAEARELQKLYDHLPTASLEAAEALRSAGRTPTDAALQRFRELDAYVRTIIDRIKEILG
jgi:hypothetical protein